jgi:hypothetical protein
MNYSEEHKVIWLAPERCATKLVSEIFTNYGFKVYRSEKSLGDIYHSHSIKIPENFEDYKIICSMRNPYDRVLSIFVHLTMIGNNAVYTKKNKENFQSKFESFLEEIFDLPEVRNQEKNLSKFPVFNTYITKLRLDGIHVTNFIRMESLVEDLNNLDFLKNSELWNSGHFDELILNNKHINRRPYKFDEIYTRKCAKRVYDFYKNIFHLCGYDPFSFTKEEYSNHEKKKFLHGII